MRGPERKPGASLGPPKWILGFEQEFGCICGGAGGESD